MIAFLIDADNLSAPAWLDEAFQILERTEGSIAVRRAYGSAENLKGLADKLRGWVIRPFVNLPLSKNTTDMSLAVDAMELACLTPRPKLIVIGSGDLDFVPLVVRLRERGIKVVCVTERRKMAQDVARAYDQVIYVGDDQVGHSTTVAANANPTATMPDSAAPKKAVAKAPGVKKPASKTVVEEKKTVKNAVKKAASTSKKAVTVDDILGAFSKLKTADWIRLSDVAKVLHDKELLGKNVSSTTVFKKFPENFELKPKGKPNEVRYIGKTGTNQPQEKTA